MKINTEGNIPQSGVEFFSKQLGGSTKEATLEELSLKISDDRTHLTVIGQFRDNQGIYKRTTDYRTHKFTGLTPANGMLVDAYEEGEDKNGPYKSLLGPQVFVSSDVGPTIVTFFVENGVQMATVCNKKIPGMTPNRLALANQERQRYQDIIKACDMCFVSP